MNYVSCIVPPMFALRLARLPMIALALLSLLALASVLSGNPLSVSLARADLGPLGTADLGVQVGLVEALLLALVSGIGLVVATYSARNLAGQDRLVRYAALETITVAGLAATVTAASLPVLATGWTVATLALSGLVAHAGTSRARQAARQVRTRLLVGDLLLWAGVVVVGARVGTLDRDRLAEAVGTAPAAAVTVAALLVVGSGVVRSALLPAHRWLPETAEAPSPVSALLHAGLVNGVGVLALLVWPLLEATPAARVALLGVGAVTAVVATAQMRTRADVKGRLAASTSSQMGYLAVQAGLGIPAAVLAHVIGHGVWKASLFLGAGGAVERSRRRDAMPSSRPSPRLVTAAGVTAAGAVGAAALLPLASWPALTAPAELLPLAMATALGWLALVAVARQPSPGRARALAAGLSLAVVAAYVVGLRTLGHLLSGVVGEPEPWGTAWGWATAAAVLALVGTGVAMAAVDASARAGRLPAQARRAARAALQPWTLRERMSGRPSVALATPPVSQEDAETARRGIEIAARTGGALYPLTAFVATNPLAGLEDLGIEDATRIAVDVGGARPGPTARVLREALADGRVVEADLETVLAEATGGDGYGAALARVVLLADPPPPDALAAATSVLESAGIEPDRLLRTPLEVLAEHAPGPDRRARDVANHCCARSLAGPAWPGAAGPWQELRASAGALDGMLGVRGAGAVVTGLPEDAAAAVAALFEHLGLSPRDRAALLARLLARDPGWPAHLAWRARHADLGREAGIEDPTGSIAAEDLLDELVATRLALEVVVAEAHTPRLLGRPFETADLAATSHERLATGLATATVAGLVAAEPSRPEVERAVRALAPLTHGTDGLLRATVLERAFRRGLLRTIGAPAAGRAAQPRAQLVTCIDVRSERLRRHLEHLGPWETLGAAGFFGIPLRHRAVSGTVTERAPALLRPSVGITERPGVGGGVSGTEDGLLAAVATLETAPGAPFGWAELVGWAQAPFVLLATALPRAGHRLRERSRGLLGLPRHGRLDVVADVGAPALADAAADFLATLGTPRLAPLVVIAGHGARVSNNPHVAAYDCGACGGSAGDVNARAMAQALNDPAVRAELRTRGVVVPDGTRFVPAVHDTTRDHVEVLDRATVPGHLEQALGHLEADLARAGDGVRDERLALLPDARPGSIRRPRRAVEDRAADWAQPRPEWGLAGAAAIVVGPRELTAGKHLDGRVFLQSYRPELDPDGAVLEQLLAAPVVVAQWITAQYWASTVDPHRFGAGDKTTHNVLGDGATLSAVLTGARGDLRLGLPWQAVSATAPGAPGSGEVWRAGTAHEPMRLLAVVCAETSTVERVLARQPSVARLVAGGWITLSVIGPEGGRALVRTRDGAWLSPEAVPSAAPARQGVGGAS